MKISTNWNLNLIVPEYNDYYIEKEKAVIEKEAYKFIDKWKDRKDYLEDPVILLEALKEYENWVANYGVSGDLGYYLGLKSSLETDNPKIKAEINLLQDLSLKISNDVEFFTHRISKIPPEKQKKFLEYEGLREYKHLLQKSFENAKYLLSEEEEKIMNLKGPTSYSNWVRMTSEFISKEEAKVLDENNKIKKKPFSEITSLLSSQNKKVRDKAAKEFNKILRKHSDVAEHEINSILENKKINDNLRGFSRPDQASHIGDDIDTEVVDSLISNVSERYDLSKKYYELKSKLLKVDKLDYHERNVPYGKVDKKYTYEEASQIIHRTLDNLDPEFAKIFEDFSENGQIDVYPKKSKSDGAFCSHSKIKHPIYVLLNYTDKLTDIITIAHEFGHATNYELMKKEVTELNYGNSIAVAETASSFVEDFVIDEIMRGADDELRLSILMMKLNSDVSTIQRQIACYKFEQELHKDFRQKGYLPKSDIGELFTEHMNAYMGNFVKQSKGSENWWVYWGHIRQFFYVYSYASGLLVSKSLQNMVKNDPKFINNVKAFFSSGLKDSPSNIFKKVGIDITKNDFWKKGLQEQQKLLEQAWVLAEKLKKI